MVVIGVLLQENGVDFSGEAKDASLKEKLQQQLEQFMNLSSEATQRCIKSKEVASEDAPAKQEIVVQENSKWGISFGSIVDTQEKTKKTNIYDESLLAATGKLTNTHETNMAKKVVALTGMSDPVYAEAAVVVSNFDVRFDVLVVNQTQDYLQNVTVDMRTQGDYRVVMRSPPVALAPYKFTNVHVRSFLKGVFTFDV